MGMALSGIAGLGSLICWIMVLIKMFTDQEKGGAVHGIIGIVTCGLWSFIWGWINSSRVGKNIMIAWTVCIVLGFIGNAMTASQMMPAQ